MRVEVSQESQKKKSVKIGTTRPRKGPSKGLVRAYSGSNVRFLVECGCGRRLPRRRRAPPGPGRESREDVGPTSFSVYPVVVNNWVQYLRTSGTLLLPRFSGPSLGSLSRTSSTLLLLRFSGPPRGSRRTSLAEREPPGRIP